MTSSSKHPLAIATERFFESDTSQEILSVDAFLESLASGVVALEPNETIKASEALVQVAETLRLRGAYELAAALARTVAQAARRATAKHVGAAPMSAKAEVAGERFLEFIGVGPSRTLESAGTSPKPKSESTHTQRFIEKHWARMSDERRAALASLVDELLPCL